ncbi:hypothetical protein BBK36DRAFT_1142864 [Trichoderma citrinoviride]|uniref:Uncharacterized protein n=1 Tax=Trichoderma citrinoviride TaxID=58853 RepID=A0A2T4B6K7_9HYPO|nr:hypothetical protein BBK36DRAFT_1142864 [Trichoderma citrinoviride]PTB64940.1 hypothetical protein BBK36DRAFT_1142864 [Trichoderma citrinoviride]
MASALQTDSLIMMRNISTSIAYNPQRQPQSYQAIARHRNSVRNFANYASLRSKPLNNDELPSFSFEGPGMSRNVKIFVIAVLSIFGTIETWVWCKGIYRWWNGAQKEEKED